MSEILFALNWVHQKLKKKVEEIEEFLNQVDEWEKKRKVEVLNEWRKRKEENRVS